METFSLTSEARSGPLDTSVTQTLLMNLAGAPINFLNPKSAPSSIFKSKFHSPQPRAALFFLSPPLTPTHFVASGHFVHGDLPIRSLRLLPHTSKFAETGEPTSEACEHFFTTACWRMGFLPLTQWDTVRRHFQSLSEHRAPRQSLLSTNWSSPLGFVYLNETLRPSGVCWEKVRNAKYLFFFRLHPLSSFLSSFSLIASQLGEPKILGKHPGPAAL